MSYRKITVLGNEYEYTVGESHTKIKGVGTYLNEEIGIVSMNEEFDPLGQTPNFAVTPGVIERLIVKSIGE